MTNTKWSALQTILIYNQFMNNLSEYIEKYEISPLKEKDYTDLYLSLIKKSMLGTDLDDLVEKSNCPILGFNEIFEGYSRIALARLLNSAAWLYNHGHEPFPKEVWQLLMERLLEDLLGNHEINGAEFTVLEICQTLISYGNEDGRFSGLLSKINPYEKYHSTLEKLPPEELHNFCMYGICAEYLRSLVTGIPADDFIERHWEVQKKKFNNRGMYMDPDCPHVYDITSRYRLALMLGYGYRGSVASEMKNVLMEGAKGLLFFLSADYKFPFGGRSNQYQFNEALFASLCEFYCKEYAESDPVKAGMFRRCAGKCIEGLGRWMDIEEPRHIKNMFSTDSGFGIDSYGSYNSYMTSTGSFITGALKFTDRTVMEYTPPCELGGYIHSTDMDFHKVFASAGGYSVQIDLSADSKFDSTGLGRIHLYGAPCELALSIPFTGKPKYRMPENMVSPGGRCIGPYWMEKGQRVYLAETGLGSEPSIIEERNDKVFFSVRYDAEVRGCVTEEYEISKDGITAKYSADFSEIGICVPLLHSNGSEKTEIEMMDSRVSVKLGGYIYTVSWESGLECEISNALLYNRNGVYRELDIRGNAGSLCVKYRIQKEL